MHKVIITKMKTVSQNIQTAQMKVLSRRMSDGIAVVHVAPFDKYSARRRHRLTRAAVRAFTNYLQWYLERRPEMEFEHRRNLARKLSYMPSGMRAWREYIPGGFATFYAQNPEIRKMKNGKRLDTITHNFFRHTYDAVGLRSRADILSWIVLEKAKHSTEPLVWFSIAAGSCQTPYATFDTMSRAATEESCLVVLDSDPVVLKFAEELYAQQTYTLKSIEFINQDVFETSARERLRVESPNIVDAMGLFEYLNDTLSIELAREIYASLAEGGLFVFTNMNFSRKHLHVHQRALGWPGVIQRDVHDVAALLARAQIPASAITAYIPDDGVYTVYKVVK